MGIEKNVKAFLKNRFHQSILDYSKVDLSNNSTHVFIACMPKSGSTFLSNTLTEITKFENRAFRLLPIDNIYEHEVYLPAVNEVKDINTITQQHCRGSVTNFEILNRISAFIFVQTRNIFDIVVSTYDHSENSGKIGSSMAYGNNKYFNLSKEEKLGLIVDFVVPWHIHFFVSWYDRIRENTYDRIQWVAYEDLRTNEVRTIKEILDFSNLKYEEREIEKGIEVIKSSRNKARFNKGISGRGEHLSNEIKEKIKSMTKYYPWVDFSRIGIKK